MNTFFFVSYDKSNNEKFQLLGDIWHHAVESTSAFNKKYFKRQTSSDQQISTLKYPTTFDDLTDRLSSLLECQAALFKRYVSMSSPLVAGMIVLLDNIDCADHIDVGLTMRLLTLKDVCI